MAQPSASFGPGDIIDGKYKVELVLGEGGMGIVLAATQLMTGRSVAVKLLHPKLARVGVIRERFLREARSASALKSPHVVKVLEVGSDSNGTPYLVMERLYGHNLEELVAGQGKLHEDSAIDYLLEACDALAEAHGLGIVHRDLKPENLFISGDRLRVLDFGISKNSLDQKQLTAVGEVMGTPHYMAPEQFKCAREATARADVWAFGVILYRLLGGALPFDAANAVDLAVRVERMAPVPLEQLQPRLSAEIAAVVRRCLAKDPLARFANATELRRALEDVRERTRANSRLAFAATAQAIAPVRVPNAQPSLLAQLAKPTPKRHRGGYTLLVGAVFASLLATLSLTQRSAFASADVTTVAEDTRFSFTPETPEPAATQHLGARVGADGSEHVSKGAKGAGSRTKK